MEAPDESVARGPRTVVVVDDDLDVRETVAAILSEEGYSVRTAANGREALDILAQVPHPGVVLLDLSMPEMNGAEFIASAAADPAFASIPVILMTTVPSNSKPMTKRVLPKPIDFTTLLRVVRETCGPGSFPV